MTEVYKNSKERRFFILPEERAGTDYHEFYRGAWDEETFWREDSLLLSDDLLREHPGIYKILKNTLTDYDPYASTEVTAEQWELLKEALRNGDDDSADFYEELLPWVEETFETEECFTILGI